VTTYKKWRLEKGKIRKSDAKDLYRQEYNHGGLVPAFSKLDELKVIDSKCPYETGEIKIAKRQISLPALKMTAKLIGPEAITYPKAFIRFERSFL
jgi:hypothetical protein